MLRGEPSTLFMMLEKVFFLRGLELELPSSELRFALGATSSIWGSAVSIREIFVKLAD